MDIPTKARYLHLTDKVFTREDGLPFFGDFVEGEVIFRCRGLNGKLDGGMYSAISDGARAHLEFWKDGKLHREDGPAVVSLYGDYQEYWINGMKLDTGEPQKRLDGSSFSYVPGNGSDQKPI